MSDKNKSKRGAPLGPQRDRGPGKPTGLAAKIIRKRIAEGLSQEALAAVLGVHRGTIARWELGAPARGLYRKTLLAWLEGEVRP